MDTNLPTTVVIQGESYQLRQARPQHLLDILSLLLDASKWLETKGTTQWDYYRKDLEGNAQEVVDSMEKGNTFVLEKEDDVIASLTLEPEASEFDIDLWGEEAKAQGATYLHRLVVLREHAGKGIGAGLMKWAEQYVKDAGKTKLRFDCLAENEGLNAYYQKQYDLKRKVDAYGGHCIYEVSV